MDRQTVCGSRALNLHQRLGGMAETVSAEW